MTTIKIKVLSPPPLQKNLRLVNFSAGKEGLCIFPIHIVSIYIYVIKRIVLTNTLCLVVEGFRRFVVIDTNVGNSCFVFLNVLAGEFVVCSKRFYINISQVICILGAFDVSFQVFAFRRQIGRASCRERV